MMKNARRGKNWDGAEKEVMGKRSAEEPANFAVSPIDRYVSKFEILIYFIIEMHVIYNFCSLNPLHIFAWTTIMHIINHSRLLMKRTR